MKKILKFEASWCQPCKMLTKTLEGVETNIDIERVDIDENAELAMKYGIRGVPTMILIEDDKEVKRMSGMKNKDELEKWINE